MEATVALGQVHSDEKNSTQMEMGVMSRSGSSSTSGESSSQGAAAGNLESKTLSAVTSTRTSTAFSEDTLDVESRGHAEVAQEEFKQ